MTIEHNIRSINIDDVTRNVPRFMNNTVDFCNFGSEFSLPQKDFLKWKLSQIRIFN